MKRLLHLEPGTVVVEVTGTSSMTFLDLTVFDSQGRVAAEPVWSSMQDEDLDAFLRRELGLPPEQAARLGERLLADYRGSAEEREQSRVVRWTSAGGAASVLGIAALGAAAASALSAARRGGRAG